MTKNNTSGIELQFSELLGLIQRGRSEASQAVNEKQLLTAWSVGGYISAKNPQRMVFRDSCFREDKQKINLFEQFKQLLDWSEEEARKNIRVI